MRITVYSQVNCQPCRATKRWLDKRGIIYTEVDVSTSPNDLAAIKALGYQSAPVVIVNRGDTELELHWAGFDPTNLTKYATKAA